MTTRSTPIPRVMNPLWIISLFLGTAELTAGIAATQVSGWVQGLLAIFTVVFPVGVSVAFFGILWKRPYVLYAPADFPRHTSVTAFVEAMSAPSRINTSVIETMVKAALEAAAPDSTDSRTDTRSAAIGDALASAKKEIDESVVHVSLQDVGRGWLGWTTLPAFDDSTVDDLLDRIWFLISEYAPPYTYGEVWDLVHLGADSEASSLDSPISAARQDKRLLSEVGIQKGDRLAVRFLHKAEDRSIP